MFAKMRERSPTFSSLSPRPSNRAVNATSNNKSSNLPSPANIANNSNSSHQQQLPKAMLTSFDNSGRDAKQQQQQQASTSSNSSAPENITTTTTSKTMLISCDDHDRDIKQQLAILPTIHSERKALSSEQAHAVAEIHALQDDKKL